MIKTKTDRWLLLAALIAIFGALSGFAHGSTPRALDTRNLGYLDKFRADCTKSILAENPEAILGYYAENVRLMPEYQKTVLGKTNASSYHKAFGHRFLVQEYSREKKEITDLGLRVVEIGFFTMKLALKSTGQKRELFGKYVDIWEKAENGELSLITEAWNYNHEVPFSDELRFAEVPAVHMALQGHLPITSDVSFELAALNKLLEAVVSQRDARTWARFFTDDGMFIYSHHPLYEGRKALDNFLESHAKELPIFEHLDIRNDRIDDLGAYVIEYASHIANWRNGESSGVGTGKDIRIWRREPDGSLKLYRAVGMYD